MTTIAPTPSTTARRPPAWRLPLALIALGAIPMLFGGLRLIEILGGLALMPARPSFVASPVPVAVHIASAIVYITLGALQFSAGLRRGRPRWHRYSGRVLVPLGLLVAFSALWMNQFYELPDGPNPLLYVFRLVFGTAMAASIVVGFLAVRRGDIRTHRAWMIRAYAIGLGPGPRSSPSASAKGSSARRRSPLPCATPLPGCSTSLSPS